MEDDVAPPGPGGFTRDLVRWSETLAAIARTGLGFTENLYERERFEEVLNVAADIKAAANQALGVAVDDLEAIETAREQDHFVQEWLESVGVGVPGYVTPKVAIGAVVGNDQGQLLLVQRADSRDLAVPDRLGGRRVLAGRGRRQGGRRGDRHRVRAAAGARGHRRSADGVLPLRHVHAAVPLHGHRRRAAAAPAGVRRRRLVRARRPAAGDGRRRSGGRRWRSRRSTARSSRPSSTPCARRSGGR